MRLLNRRDFLNDSALFAAALAAVPHLTHSTRAEDKPSGPKGSANDRIQVAVIGVRGQGSGDTEDFVKNPSHNCVVATICDCDEAVIGRAMTVAEKYQGFTPKYEKDLRRVLDDKSIHAVSIATPNHWHALAAIWAMQAGKDVYVQKPVSHNVLEGRRMVEAARKYGRICQTGTQSRSNQGMREALSYIHSGKLGKVYLARGLCYKRRPSIGLVSGEQPIPKTIDYNLWTGPAPIRPLLRKQLHYDWHWIWDYGNGDLGNQGIHEMDKARWGLGKNELPRSVISLGGRFGYVDDGETPNTMLIRYDYGDCELLFEVRGLPTGSPYPGKSFAKEGKKRQNYVGNIWYGTEGFLVCPSYSSGVAFNNDGEVVAQFNGGGDHKGNFLKAVRSRRYEDLTADIAEGHLSSALCHLGNISHRLGEDEPMVRKVCCFGDSKPAGEALSSMLEHLSDNKVAAEATRWRVGRLLVLDPKTERVVNDQQASLLLSREYRKGFEVPDQV